MKSIGALRSDDSKKKQSDDSRQAIFLAAEIEFAEYGFAGTRVDSIAARSGYNKTLIFRYYSNKLGLYTAVLQRADQELGQVLKRVFAPLLADESLVADAQRFREFLAATIGALFDYMVEHPRFTRIINWEQAAAWQTLIGIASQFAPEDFSKLAGLVALAQADGLLRADLDAVLAVLLVQQLCWSVPNSTPLYQMFLAGPDRSSAAALAHVREQLIAFSVNGMMPGALLNQKG